VIEIDRSGWRRVRFGDVVTSTKETVKDPVSAGLDRVVALEHMEPGCLQLSGWQDAADETTFTRRFRAGQTLFAKRRAYQRKVAHAEFDGVCSGDILVFEAKPNGLLPDLLPFIVQSDAFFEHALRTSAGSLSPRTKWQDLAMWEFDLPPLDEQKRIAELLWLSESHNRMLAAQHGQIMAVYGLLLGSLLDSTDRLLSVGDALTLARAGGTPLRSVSEYYNGTIPWLKSGEVRTCETVPPAERITELGLKESSAWVVPQGAVLVAMYGDGKTRGEVGQTAAPLATNQAVLALVVEQSRADSRFLFHWMRYRQPFLREASEGGAQKNLNKEIVLAQPFPDIAVPRQRELAERLDALLDCAAASVGAIEQSARLVKSLVEATLGAAG